MSEQVHTWVRRARKLNDEMQHSIRRFHALSNTYEGMRNVAPSTSNSKKSAIDAAYHALTDTRERLCSIQSGGAKRYRKTRRVLTPYPPRRRGTRRTKH